MELVKGQNVAQFLQDVRGGNNASLKRRLQIAQDVALGMIELHSFAPPVMYV